MNGGAPTARPPPTRQNLIASAPRGAVGSRSGGSMGNQHHPKQGPKSSRSQNTGNDAGQPSKTTVHGEGNYAASKQYNDAPRDFVKSGPVDKAAHDAAPK